MSEFHAEVPRDLHAQGPYSVAARAGYELTTLRATNLPMSHHASQYI